MSKELFFKKNLSRIRQRLQNFFGHFSDNVSVVGIETVNLNGIKSPLPLKRCPWQAWHLKHDM